MLTEISRWREAAAKIYNKWDKEYDACINRNNADILSAKTEHSSIPADYWHPLHKAFVRRESARQLLEIIREVEAQCKLELEQKQKRSDGGANICMEHTGINPIPAHLFNPPKEEKEPKV